jgi:hypothetical protein
VPVWTQELYAQLKRELAGYPLWEWTYAPQKLSTLD